MRVPAARTLVGAALACAIAIGTDRGSAAEAARASAEAHAIEPKQFVELATGVVLIRTFDCGGNTKTTGSGFLVGASVVMTARHVAFQPKTLACKIKVRAGGRWIPVASRHRWATRGRLGKLEDIATLKLTRPVVGAHIFEIATSSPRKWTNLAMIGHPLGNAISLTQGLLLSRYTESHVPFLAINLLGAEGASGSAIVNERGTVVGILQRGSGSEDPLGEITGGLVFGIDLAKVWDTTSRRALCRGYPAGGIPSCEQSVSLGVTGVSLKPSGSGGAAACAIETTATVPCLTVPASETQVTIGLAFDAGAVGAHALSSSIAGPRGSGAAPCSQRIPAGKKSINCTFTIPRPLQPGDYSWSWTVTNSSSGTPNRTGAVTFTVLPA